MLDLFRNYLQGKAAALFILCAALILCGCGAGKEPAREPEQPQERQELQEAEEAAPEKEQESGLRVAALSRSVGELWTLAGGTLVGITEDGMDLEGLSEDAVSIGSLSRPSLEAILACEPDLLLLTEDLSAHRKVAEELQEIGGIEIMTIDLESFDDYDKVMQELTGRTGREDLYEQNVTAVRERIGKILETYGTQREETYLCMRVSATKNKVLKEDNFACAIISSFGLSNIAQDSSALDELNLEAIAAADPDRIYVVFQGEEKEAQAVFEEAFASQSVWKDLTAIREGRLYILPKELFQYKPNAAWDKAYQHIADSL